MFSYTKCAVVELPHLNLGRMKRNSGSHLPSKSASPKQRSPGVWAESTWREYVIVAAVLHRCVKAQAWAVRMFCLQKCCCRLVSGVSVVIVGVRYISRSLLTLQGTSVDEVEDSRFIFKAMWGTLKWSNKHHDSCNTLCYGGLLKKMVVKSRQITLL